MRGELGAEERDEVRVHGGVVVGHAGYDEGLVGEFGGETVGHPGGVFRAGRAGRVVRRGVEQGLGPGGEPPVARAEEEAFGFHRGSGRGGETKKSRLSRGGPRWEKEPRPGLDQTELHFALFADHRLVPRRLPRDADVGVGDAGDE